MGIPGLSLSQPSLPETGTPEVEPQQMSAKVMSIEQWVAEQDATEQAATAVKIAESESKKTTPVSSQVVEEQDGMSRVTDSPAPTAAATPAASSRPITGPAAAILLGEVNWIGKLHGEISFMKTCGP